MAEPRPPSGTEESWSWRLAVLARMGRVDALAVVLPLSDDRYFPYAAHNLAVGAAWLTNAMQLLVSVVRQQRAPQLREDPGVALRDGRAAAWLLVAPIPWRDRVLGGLLVLRADGAPTAEDAARATQLAELVGLELAVEGLALPQQQARTETEQQLRQAREDKAHAIALYELSRVIVGATGGDGADRAAAVLADILGYEIVGIFRHEPAGVLRLASSRGYADPPASLQIADDATLTEVVERGSTLRVAGETAQSAWRGCAAEALVTPIGAGRRPGTATAKRPLRAQPEDGAVGKEGEILGVLVLGRSETMIGDGELNLAPTLAECLAPLLAPSGPAALAPSPAAPPSLPSPAAPDTRTLAPSPDRPVAATRPSEEAPLRVLAVEDHPVMRAGLETLLERAGFAVVAVSGTCAEAVQRASEEACDVAVLDLGLPDARGIEVVERLRAAVPRLPVVVFSVDRSPDLMRAALRAGANGYVGKDAPAARVVAALRAAAAGLDVAVDLPSLIDLPDTASAGDIPAREAGPSGGAPPPPRSGFQPREPLTARELELLRFLAEGYTNKEIARVMVLAEDTVKKAVQSLIAKLEATDRTHAVGIALRAGLIE